MKVVLISTYELGHQPFGLASPAAWPARAGPQVTVDASLDAAARPRHREADLVASTCRCTPRRGSAPLIASASARTRAPHLCLRPVRAAQRRACCAARRRDSILGGEFEAGLVGARARGCVARPAQPDERAATQPEPVSRSTASLPSCPIAAACRRSTRYATLQLPDGAQRVVGYTEATRGCKHLCRHCPIVPVYGGQLPRRPARRRARGRPPAGRGRRASTSRSAIPTSSTGRATRCASSTRLHASSPTLTYDVTIKVEHLAAAARRCCRRCADTGCLFVTSAVESVDDAVLERSKGPHPRQTSTRSSRCCRAVGLTLAPTFVAFTPWTTLEGYVDLLETIAELDLVDHVAPIQLAIRLLIPAGSRLLELDEVVRARRAVR